MIDKNSEEGIAWYVEWTKLFDSICEVFPNAKPEAATCDAYADRLFDLDSTLLRAAVEQVICTHKYGSSLPTIADIRDAARMLTEPVKHTGLEVWGATIRELLASYNEHRPVNLEPSIKALVDALGGRNSVVESNKPGIERAQFLKAWERREAENERMRKATPIAREYAPEPERIALPEPKPKPVRTPEEIALAQARNAEAQRARNEQMRAQLERMEARQ